MPVPKKKKPVRGAARGDENGELLPGIDSHFRLIIVAALRSKQLLRGALTRIEPDTLRRKNTSIAIEEVRRGLVPFTNADRDREGDPVAE